VKLPHHLFYRPVFDISLNSAYCAHQTFFIVEIPVGESWANISLRKSPKNKPYNRNVFRKKYYSVFVFNNLGYGLWKAI
jgi:hypothetical protein